LDLHNMDYHSDGKHTFRLELVRGAKSKIVYGL
jgi:hypothetical protein